MSDGAISADELRRLQESAARLRLIADSVPVLIWTAGIDGRCEWVNRAWTEFTGRTLEQEVADGWVAGLHPDDRGRHEEAYSRHFRRREAFRIEHRLRRADGAYRWMICTGTPYVDPSGRFAGYIGSKLDITERRRTEEALQESEERLRLALAASSQEVWEYDVPGDRTMVVRAMRSLGRPEGPPDVEEIDVRGELLNAVRMARNQVLQRARLEVDVPQALPRVRSGAGELGRVFLNLLLNAAQAIPAGDASSNRVAVSARGEGEEVVVEIADSGVGLEPDVKERMFEPFFTTKETGQGTGLGLTLSRDIVEAAGGRIEAEGCAGGRGTLFRVRLPAVDRPAGAGAEAPRGRRVRRRVLVIDDEPLVRRSVKRMLQAHHQVTTAGSAAEALRVIDADPSWDAILCDVMMPDADGIALHDALAARHPGLLPRLAFLTGGAFGERAASFLADRRSLVVPKPLQPERLLEAIEQLAGAPR